MASVCSLAMGDRIKVSFSGMVFIDTVDINSNFTLNGKSFVLSVPDENEGLGPDIIWRLNEGDLGKHTRYAYHTSPTTTSGIIINVYYNEYDGNYNLYVTNNLGDIRIYYFIANIYDCNMSTEVGNQLDYYTVFYFSYWTAASYNGTVKIEPCNDFERFANKTADGWLGDFNEADFTDWANCDILYLQ
jgi:hypothetical protein